MKSDSLLLALPQGLERQRLGGWRYQEFELGEGEEQGYHRAAAPRGSWEPVESLTMRARPDSSSVWYRAEFSHPGWGERTLIRFDGAFMAANVWLNGRLLGSHYGYPGHFGFDISSFLETSNVIAVCVEARGEPGHLPPALSGIADESGVHWPLGLVGRVWLEQVGSVVVESLDTTWRLLPGLAEASLKTTIRNLDAREMEVVVGWQLLAPESETAQVRWRRSTVVPGRQSVQLDTQVAVDRPQLWWPWTLGDQQLYSLVAVVETGERRSSAAARSVGIRVIDLEPSAGGMAWTINGRRHFPRGAVLPPLPPGDDGGPIGAWRLAGLDLAVSRGQVPSERTAAAADAAGVLLVVDPPAYLPGQGDEEAHAEHLREAVGLVASHASAAVLLQRGAGGVLEGLPNQSASDEPYVLTGAVRSEVEKVRRAKFSPLTALVLKELPDLDEAGGALASAVALLECTTMDEREVLRLRFHVVNEDAALGGRAVVRWRLRVIDPPGWMPFLRDRGGEVDVLLPRPDQPPSVYEVEVSAAARRGPVMVEVGLEKDGDLLSYLEYEVDPAVRS